MWIFEDSTEENMDFYIFEVRLILLVIGTEKVKIMDSILQMYYVGTLIARNLILWIVFLRFIMFEPL